MSSGYRKCTFLKPIRACVAEKYVLAFLPLHNNSRQTSNTSYTSTEFMNSEKSNGTIHLSEWREEIQCERTKAGGFRNVRPVRGLLYREECIVMLYELKKYLRSDVGSVPWQLDYYRGKYKIFFFFELSRQT